MATKRAAGAAKNVVGKCLPKYRGLKVGNGELVNAGSILIRQKGTPYYNGVNTDMGRDHTIFAKFDGIVRFYKGYKNRTFVTIDPVHE